MQPLFNKWNIIFFIGLIGASISFVYNYRKPIMYKAILNFTFEENDIDGFSNMNWINNNLVFNIENNPSSILSRGNLNEIMKSRLLVEEALLLPVCPINDTISLAEYYIQQNNLRRNWINNPLLNGIHFLHYGSRKYFSFQQDSILKSIHEGLIGSKQLNIKPKIKNSSITSIEVINTDEKFAKFFCENLAKAVNKLNFEITAEKSRLNMKLLQNQFNRVRFELNNAIIESAVESNKDYNLNQVSNFKKTARLKKQFDVNTNTLLLVELGKSIELSKVILEKNTSLIQVIDNPILPLEKIQVNKFKPSILGGFLACFLSILYFKIFEVYKMTVKKN
jgi:hypothetical protein